MTIRKIPTYSPDYHSGPCIATDWNGAIDDITDAIAAVGGGSITRHTPTGNIDGANTSFAFSPAPAAAAGFLLLWNGLIVDPSDYSLAGDTVVTTGFTAQSGDKLYGLY